MIPVETLLKEVLALATPVALVFARHVAEDIEADVAKKVATRLGGLVRRQFHSLPVQQSGTDKHLTLLSQYIHTTPQANLPKLLPRSLTEDEGLYACV